MNDENEKLLREAGKDLVPSDLHFGCGDGWTKLIHPVFFYAAHHLGRWREVQNIKESILSCVREKCHHEGHHSIDGQYDWINEYFRDNPADPMLLMRFTCIKEKFGGLRIYYTGGSSEYLDGLITMAEALSFTTCEQCGKEGQKRHTGGYIYVSCEEHKD